MDNSERLRKLEEEINDFRESKYKDDLDKPGSHAAEPGAALKAANIKTKKIQRLEQLRAEYAEDKGPERMRLQNRIRISKEIQDLERELGQGG